MCQIKLDEESCTCSKILLESNFTFVLTDILIYFVIFMVIRSMSPMQFSSLIQMQCALWNIDGGNAWNLSWRHCLSEEKNPVKT